MVACRVYLLEEERRTAPSKVYYPVMNIGEDVWSLVIGFHDTPMMGRWNSAGVSFLFERAPADTLVSGFKFNAYEGDKVTAIVEII